MSEPLKPCPLPWCKATYNHPQRVKTRKVLSGDTRFRVECVCGVVGPFGDTESEAVVAWNTRPTDALWEGIANAAERQLVEAERLQSVHLDALRDVSAALGNPFKGDPQHSCCDLGPEVTKQLAEARKAAEWALIDEEHLPKMGNEVWRDEGEEYGGVSVEAVDVDMAKWPLEDWQIEHWTHYRSINAPHTEDKAEKLDRFVDFMREDQKVKPYPQEPA